MVRYFLFLHLFIFCVWRGCGQVTSGVGRFVTSCVWLLLWLLTDLWEWVETNCVHPGGESDHPAVCLQLEWIPRIMTRHLDHRFSTKHPTMIPGRRGLSCERGTCLIHNRCPFAFWQSDSLHVSASKSYSGYTSRSTLAQRKVRRSILVQSCSCPGWKRGTWARVRPTITSDFSYRKLGVLN